MTETDVLTRTAPRESLIRLTHVMYGLHAFSALMGLLGSAFVVTTFLTGWPSIVAVIINYVKRGDVRGAYLESHFGWQLRTFWFALLAFVVAGLFIFTFIGIPIGWGIAVATGIWVLYRITRGWMTLNDGKSMPV
ncbi:MAG: DUF4870 family protein [Burkholderiales bacterium]